MSLNQGRPLLAIPGPSVIPDRVLNAMHQPSPNIYEGPIIALTESLLSDLKKVARTKGDVAIYVANGHGAWEAALRNSLKQGDKILVLGTGRFGLGWGEMAAEMGVVCEVLDFGMQETIDYAAVRDRLEADRQGTIRAVLCVHVDTASSVLNDIQQLREALTDVKHEALLMVDCIASLGCDRFEMDAWGVDVMVAGCQKGLMTPAGMSFVFFNEKAQQARKRCKPGRYWDWVPRINPAIFYHHFCGTPPTHHLFGLREALTMLLAEEGLEAAWARHETIAYAIWAAIEAWGNPVDVVFRHNITRQAIRSRAVSTIKTANGAADKIRKWSEHNSGVTLGISLGFGEAESVLARNHFRIGHMGHQNIAMVMGALSTIDTALKAQNIKHGPGALEAATRVFASHPGQKSPSS